jgi:AraC family transcriptional regulator
MLSSHIQLIERTTGNCFAAAPDGTVLKSSYPLGWRGITVEWQSIPPLEMPEHCLEGHRLMVHIGKPALFEWKEDDCWRYTLLKPGDFCLQTHRDLNFPRWHDSLEFLAIALDPNLMSHWFQDTKAPETIHFQTLRGRFDPVIAQVAQRFQTELASNSYGGALYGESLALAFAVHLIEQYCTQPKNLPRPHSKLSALHLRQFVEYVHEHLSNELSLIELANQVNLSAYYFTRLVKNSLGLSPHQYVLKTRIERAKQLITFSQPLNLAEIGLQVGFYDHAHFTKAFKRLVGVSPSQFLGE